MTSETETFFEQFDLEETKPSVFSSCCKNNGWYQIFGGQLMAQALATASQQLGIEWLFQTYQANFLLPGDLKKPIFYQLKPIRDGNSICIRQVNAMQDDRVLFQLTASFSKAKTDYLDHQDVMPNVPPPEQCLDWSAAERLYKARFPGHFVDQAPKAKTEDELMDVRLVDLADAFKQSSDSNPTSKPHAIWTKLKNNLKPKARLEEPILAFISDMGVAHTIVEPHGIGAADPNLRFITLNHCMWFHRRFEIDQWLLFVRQSPSASSGSGLVSASVYQQDGSLVATFIQQGLVQLPGRGK